MARESKLLALVATIILGRGNTPAIAATEFDYVETWAQTGAMVCINAGAAAVAETLTLFSAAALIWRSPPQAGAQLTGMSVSAFALSPIAEGAVEGCRLRGWRSRAVVAVVMRRWVRGVSGRR